MLELGAALLEAERQMHAALIADSILLEVELGKLRAAALLEGLCKIRQPLIVNAVPLKVEVDKTRTGVILQGLCQMRQALIANVVPSKVEAGEHGAAALLQRLRQVRTALIANAIPLKVEVGEARAGVLLQGHRHMRPPLCANLVILMEVEVRDVGTGVQGLRQKHAALRVNALFTQAKVDEGWAGVSLQSLRQSRPALIADAILFEVEAREGEAGALLQCHCDMHAALVTHLVASDVELREIGADVQGHRQMRASIAANAIVFKAERSERGQVEQQSAYCLRLHRKAPDADIAQLLEAPLQLRPRPLIAAVIELAAQREALQSGQGRGAEHARKAAQQVSKAIDRKLLEAGERGPVLWNAMRISDDEGAYVASGINGVLPSPAQQSIQLVLALLDCQLALGVDFQRAGAHVVSLLLWHPWRSDVAGAHAPVERERLLRAAHARPERKNDVNIAVNDRFGRCTMYTYTHTHAHTAPDNYRMCMNYGDCSYCISSHGSGTSSRLEERTRGRVESRALHTSTVRSADIADSRLCVLIIAIIIIIIIHYVTPPQSTTMVCSISEQRLTLIIARYT